jgi:ADP-ribosylglycohydrolase
MEKARVEGGSRPSARDRFKGSLLGCAIGDALGAPVEGMDPAAICEEYGRVTGFLDAGYGPGGLTDYTLMTVVLAQSMLEAGRFVKEHTALKFARWIELSLMGAKEGRGGDIACRTACKRLYEGASADESGINSPGCGAAARVAPIGLFYCKDRRALNRAAVEQALLTHTDPGAIAGSVAIATAVAAGISDEGHIDRASFAAKTGSAVSEIDLEMAAKISGLADYLDASPGEGFAFTGTGSVAGQSVPAALFAFLHSPYDLEKTVTEAVNAGGEADSIASMAGSISGSFNGAGAIPRSWRDGLEGGDYVESIAYRLYTLSPVFRPEPRPLF